MQELYNFASLKIFFQYLKGVMRGGREEGGEGSGAEK